MRKTLRSGEAVSMALAVPVVMMVMFGLVLGGIADVGYGLNFIDFVVPGIIIQCVLGSANTTAVAVHTDMTKGIIDRFRSMAIAKSAVMSGHVGVSIVRCVMAVIATYIAALAIGFRPQASFTEWLIIAGILLLFIFAFTWLYVIIGMIAKDAESLSGAGFLVTVFVFLSSAFAPPETLPWALRIFATHQPLSRIINAVRGLTLGIPDNGDILLAIIWCVAIGIAAMMGALAIYKKKLTQ
jgi:ABC-2 type transport system permease protein